jgi:SAM-dependent methyltransferase
LETKCQGKISYLDVGAGRGELISMMEKTFGVQAQACDYHIDRFPHKNIPIEQVNLNVDGLPYEDNSFDLVTCSEVLEHVENYRQTTRDIWRVLKPGGVAIFTTPNVLNMNSRIRYLVSGFYNLFGPLPIRNDKLYSTGGHITPIPYFYLSHALTDANFASIELDIDKRQRSSSIKAIIVSPFILIGKVLFWKSESKKYQTITAENMPLVKAHFTWDILTARTIVVSARKDA